MVRYSMACLARASFFPVVLAFPAFRLPTSPRATAAVRGLQIYRDTKTHLRLNVNGEGIKSVTSLPQVAPSTHRMVLMRHGESEFNNANIFTGWCDVALTKRGVVEAIEAGEVFRSHDILFRKCYTSLLSRSIITAQRSMEAAGVAYTPIEYDWRLNERHYGALQGLSKERTAVRLGRSKVMKWRRSFDAAPPLMTEAHPHFDSINNDYRYQSLEEVPRGESLQDCQVRVVSSWNDICKDVATKSHDDSHYSLVVAHANTLRALVMHLDNIPAGEIESLNIPTAIPFFYDIDIRTGQVVQSNMMNAVQDAGGNAGFRGVYISDERKKRSFLERRRAAYDPWLWALHDDQVSASQLNGDDSPSEEEEEGTYNESEGLDILEKEAFQNTQLFSPNLKESSRLSSRTVATEESK